MGIGIRTRILRLLQVVHPLDFPGTPTMTTGVLTNTERDLTSLDAFHVSLLDASLATCIYTEVVYIAT